MRKLTITAANERGGTLTLTDCEVKDLWFALGQYLQFSERAVIEHHAYGCVTLDVEEVNA